MLAHSADRRRSASLHPAIILSTSLYAPSIQAISSFCGWGSAVWFLRIIRSPGYFFNYDTITPSTNLSSHWQSIPGKYHSCRSFGSLWKGWTGTSTAVQIKYFCLMLMHGWMQNSTGDVSLHSGDSGYYKYDHISVEMVLVRNFFYRRRSYTCSFA